VIYLDTVEKRDIWYKLLKEASGFNEINDFYEFGDAIGKGQFGLVKKAKNKKSGLDVAIKQIKKKKISNDELDMLRNEIEVLKVCKHPNVVKLYDVFEDRSSIFIIMELITGGDLYEYLDERDFKLPDIRIKQISFNLCNGVNYLQQYGIMHRDIKL
jgi:serine/threonine protein kinase